jgi:hypothetical protein
MPGWIGWALFGILLFFYLGGQRLSQRKRLNLRNYIVYLLLDDSIRSDHKAKFGLWIQQSNAHDAMQLSSQASNVIENMADSLGAGGSTLTAHSMLWNSEAAAELRKRRAQL